MRHVLNDTSTMNEQLTDVEAIIAAATVFILWLPVVLLAGTILGTSEPCDLPRWKKVTMFFLISPLVITIILLAANLIV